MADDNPSRLVGIECATCMRRALLGFDYWPGEINRSPLPLTGRRCRRCHSTTLGWRRFTTLAEADAWAAGTG